MFKNITKKLTRYICENESDKVADLFANEGVYHDYVYGSFKGRKNIKLMVNDYFHRDAEKFNWEMFDHVFSRNIGYAKYRFGYTSKLKNYLGKRVVIGGISSFIFKKGLIASYSESVNGGLAMVQLGVEKNKMEKVFIKWHERTLTDDPYLNMFKKILVKKKNKITR